MKGTSWSASPDVRHEIASSGYAVRLCDGAEQAAALGSALAVASIPPLGREHGLLALVHYTLCSLDAWDPPESIISFLLALGGGAAKASALQAARPACAPWL